MTDQKTDVIDALSVHGTPDKVLDLMRVTLRRLFAEAGNSLPPTSASVTLSPTSVFANPVAVSFGWKNDLAECGLEIDCQDGFCFWYECAIHGASWREDLEINAPFSNRVIAAFRYMHWV